MKLLLMTAEILLTPFLLLCKGLVLGAALLPAAYLVRWAWGQGWWIGLLSVGPAYYVFGLALMLWVLLIKWGLQFRAREGAYPYLSLTSARWAAAAQFYDMARFFFLHQVRGTWIFNLYLRLLGARVGSNVIINTSTVSDWDLISIGDDTMIGDDAVILGHVGEKGLLRLGPVRIGAGCTVGRDTLIMPGVTLEDGAVLAAMSVVTKGRTLPAQTVWGGTDLRQLRSRGGRAPAVESD